jgi:hypothetical protein
VLPLEISGRQFRRGRETRAEQATRQFRRGRETRAEQGSPCSPSEVGKDQLFTAQPQVLRRPTLTESCRGDRVPWPGHSGAGLPWSGRDREKEVATCDGWDGVLVAASHSA